MKVISNYFTWYYIPECHEFILILYLLTVSPAIQKSFKKFRLFQMFCNHLCIIYIYIYIYHGKGKSKKVLNFWITVDTMTYYHCQTDSNYTEYRRIIQKDAQENDSIRTIFFLVLPKLSHKSPFLLS